MVLAFLVLSLSSLEMPNAKTHDSITFIMIPFTYAGAEMMWADHTVSLIATASMLFSGLMFGPDLDLDSKPYKRWGPLKLLWKPYQAALPHRSVLSHGPVLGTIIRIVYFLLVFSAFGATILYLSRVYVHGQQSTWSAEFNLIQSDMLMFWNNSDQTLFLGAFGGMWAGALAHTAADITWTTFKKIF